jgi:hypothetical protein
VVLDVLCEGAVVGRIMKAAAAPVGDAMRLRGRDGLSRDASSIASCGALLRITQRLLALDAAVL